MSIDAAAASGFTQAQLLQRVDVAVARKTLDAAEAQGEAALALLDAAADFAEQPVRKASGVTEPGKGRLIDVSA